MSIHAVFDKDMNSKDRTSNEAITERLYSIADEFAPKFRKSFLEAASKISDQLDIDRLAELARQGTLGEIMTHVNNLAISVGAYQTFLDVWTNTFIASGAYSGDVARDIDIGNTRIVFSPFNPKIAEFVNNYQFDLITRLSEQTRQTVANVIRDSVSQADPPLKTASRIKNSIGLTPRYEQALANYEKALRSLDPSALKRALRDKRFDRTIARAIREGTPLTEDQIKKMTDRYRERLIAHRAKTISRTESLRAVNSGAFQSWKSFIENGMVDAANVVKEWVYTHDARTRDAHSSLPSLNPSAKQLLAPFVSDLGPIMHPHDPNASAANTINCRCTMIIRLRHL